MKIFSVVSNLLLAVFIVLSGITYVMHKTTQAAYLTQAAEDSNIYQGISEIASKRLTLTSARSLGLPEEVVQKTVSEVVTEDYIKSKSTEITDQIEQVLRGESTTISIEFSDLVTKANAAGLPINSTDVRPVEIALPQTSSASTVKSAQSLDLMRFISYSLTAILLVSSLVLAYLRRYTLGLGVSLGLSAAAFLLLALLCQLFEAAVINLIELPETIRELDAYTETFIKTVVSDMTNNYLILAAVSTVLSIISLIGHTLLKSRRNASLSRGVSANQTPNQIKSQ